MEEVIEAVKEAERITALTGAGMSAESGIAPFRGEDGLWNRFDPQEYANIRAFEEDPDRCWKLFRLQIEESFDAEPHEGHKSLVGLEKEGLRSIITQNVDNLHQKAGSERVIELHGGLSKLVCPSCSNMIETEEILSEILSGEIPRCKCSTMMRPNVVLFGEPPDEKV